MDKRDLWLLEMNRLAMERIHQQPALFELVRAVVRRERRRRSFMERQRASAGGARLRRSYFLVVEELAAWEHYVALGPVATCNAVLKPTRRQRLLLRGSPLFWVLTREERVALWEKCGLGKDQHGRG